MINKEDKKNEIQIEIENHLSNDKYTFNFNFQIPRELQNNFQGIFSYIKKKYQIQFSRKSQIDSLLKKSKGKFFKVIHEVMNKCLKIQVKRLPQSFITNITIELNKKFFEKNIIEVYEEFKILPDYKDLLEKELIREEKKNLFEKFCSYNLYDLYKVFTESKRFMKDIEKIKYIDGKRTGTLHEFVAINFCSYYKNNKAHESKIIKENEKLMEGKGEKK